MEFYESAKHVFGHALGIKRDGEVSVEEVVPNTEPDYLAEFRAKVRGEKLPERKIIFYPKGQKDDRHKIQLFVGSAEAAPHPKDKEVAIARARAAVERARQQREI